MRIGIYRGLLASIGGGFQYEVALLNALSDLSSQLNHELVCINAAHESLRGLMQTRQLRYGNLPILPLGELTVTQEPPEVYAAAGDDSVFTSPKSDFEPDIAMAQMLRDEKIDMLFPLSAGGFGPESLLPFIVPIHDLQHRIQPEFPEVSAQGNAARRDYFYSNICRYATLVLVDSEAGREDVLRFYGDLIDEDRIRILPFFPPLRHSNTQPDDRDLARVYRKYKLPDKFYFYPAQFWLHKNHKLIIRALAELKDRGQHVDVVFAGSYMDKWRARNFIEVMDLVKRLGLEKQVHYLGFVPDTDMPALYTLSCGLVMPTFFGPTNMPPLEAWSYDRPVIITDLPSIREQLGEAALYVDPRDPRALADAMLTLWCDPLRAKAMATAGKRRLTEYRYEDFLKTLRNILEEGVDRVRTRRTPSYPANWLSNGVE